MYSNILWKFRTQKNFDQKENRQKKQARKEEPQMISKTTDTRITRNKHQLQHQTIITYHNKAVGKENPSLWPLKESDNFSEIQNKLSSSHVYQKTTTYHNQIDWRKWWGLRSDADTDQLPNTTLIRTAGTQHQQHPRLKERTSFFHYMNTKKERKPTHK